MAFVAQQMETMPVPEKSMAECLRDDGSESTASGGMSEPLSLPASPAEVAVWPAVDVTALLPCSLADLPSIGSIGHFAGQCSRCCFQTKGRCLNGYNCRFCHYEHEKRPRKKKTTLAGPPGLSDERPTIAQQIETIPVAEKDMQADLEGDDSETSPTDVPVSPAVDVTGLLPCSLADLPSIGSLGHFAGQCSRCCFHAKGRCTNGYNCRFCHYEHEKRPRKKKTTLMGQSGAVEVAPRRSEVLPAAAASSQPFQSFFQADVLQVRPPPGLELPAPQCAPLMMPVCSGERPIPPPPAAPPTGLMELQSIESWSIEKVGEWLLSAGLGQCADVFQTHRITGDVLLDLSADELAEIGIQAIGDRKRILRAVLLLSAAQASPQVCLPPAPQWDCAVATTPHQDFCLMTPHQEFSPQPTCSPQFVQNYGWSSFGFVHQ